MKNIHILPTDKPSRLFKDDFGKLFYSINIDQEQAHFKPQNIYITSDEEIKDGDLYITVTNNEIYKADGDTEIIMSVANKCDITTYKRTHFKIILTTDQDLIKDGVQSIDDEFIEWFVKNRSCEEVEIESWSDDFNGYWCKNYKIIIPKEEPKKYKVMIVGDGLHQQTLEEAKAKLFRYSEEEVRKISLEFFYHWWNCKGTNTEHGFDKWFEKFKKK